MTSTVDFLSNLKNKGIFNEDSVNLYDKVKKVIPVLRNMSNKIATGKIKINPNQQIKNSNIELSILFDNLDIRFSRFK